ncbi:MAG: hypothetical protein H0V33_06365 [Acidimicrobiia bacterium]|nr:hypothetical protein [Acidimicrobiia bacterium]
MSTTPAAIRPPTPQSASERPAPPSRRARREAARRSPSSILAGVAVAAAIAPIVAAAARAIAGGWVPVGDNAYFAIRARDVFTDAHPLLGTWTSASVSLGIDVNNPGPLYFDVLVVPAKLGSAAGTLVGVALLNIASVVGIALAARRRLGAPGTAVAAAGAAGLVWSMGSELLFDPWQPHALLLPALAFLVLAWALTDGDLIALPWTLALGSLLVQTHLSYAFLVPALVVTGLVGAGIRLRGEKRDDPEGWPRRRRRAMRMVVVAMAVFVACWSQPLYEEVTGAGQGNISRLASSLGEAQDVLGPSLGARVVGAVIGLPPWWGRPSVADTLRPTGVPGELAGIPDPVPAVVSLAVLAGALFLVAALARRRHDGPAGAAAAVALVALATCLYTVATLPRSIFGTPSAHQVRPLWPVSLFVTGVVVVSALRGLTRLVDHRSRTRSVALPGVAAAAAVLAGALSLPAWNPQVGPADDADSIPSVRALTAQLGALADRPEPILFDDRGLRFAEPYGIAVLVTLQEMGVEFSVENPGLIRQLGDHRADEGRATHRIFLREGVAAMAPPPGAEVVASVRGLDDDEEAEFVALTDELRDHLATEGVALTADGRSAAGAFEVEIGSGGVVTDTVVLLEAGLLPSLVQNDLLVADPSWEDRYERWTELAVRRDRQTVTVFIVPIEDGPDDG